MNDARPVSHRQLRRYWFTLSPGLGIGVTEISLAEARGLADATRDRYFPDSTIVEEIEDVEVAALDAGHVLPNAGPVVVRGVWFPRLNQ